MPDDIWTTEKLRELAAGVQDMIGPLADGETMTNCQGLENVVDALRAAADRIEAQDGEIARLTKLADDWKAHSHDNRRRMEEQESRADTAEARFTALETLLCEAHVELRAWFISVNGNCEDCDAGEPKHDPRCILARIVAALSPAEAGG